MRDFPSLPDLLAKASSYMPYFDRERPNLGSKKTPFEAAKQETEVKDRHFMLFLPLSWTIFLSSPHDYYL